MTAAQFPSNPHRILFTTDWDVRAHPFLGEFINQIPGVEPEWQMRLESKRYQFSVQCGELFERVEVARSIMQFLDDYFHFGKYDDQIEQLKKEQQLSWIERIIIKLMGKYHFELVKSAVRYKKYVPTIADTKPDVGRSSNLSWDEFRKKGWERLSELSKERGNV